jgi:hypothetical protein
VPGKPFGSHSGNPNEQKTVLEAILETRIAGEGGDVSCGVVTRCVIFQHDGPKERKNGEKVHGFGVSAHSFFSCRCFGGPSLKLRL